MHSKSSEETEDNVALYAGRVQNERMVLEKLLVGGLFQSENDDDDEEKRDKDERGEKHHFCLPLLR